MQWKVSTKSFATTSPVFSCSLQEPEITSLARFSLVQSSVCNMADLLSTPIVKLVYAGYLHKAASHLVYELNRTLLDIFGTNNIATDYGKPEVLLLFLLLFRIFT